MKLDARTMGACAVSLLAALLGPAVASAQAVGTNQEPRVLVLGFQDEEDAQDCDPVVSRYGRCVEKVQFLDLAELFSVHELDEPTARMETMGRQYAWIWDDIARRWQGDELVEATLIEDGLSRLPESGYLWDATPRQPDARTFAVPSRSLWVDGKDWIGKATEGYKPVYRYLMFHKPAGLRQPPDVVMMRGRFANRLVYDGRRHQFDIMDGDPESSGPFFEQMYPYDQALTARDTELEEEYEEGGIDLDDVPLAHFVAGERLKSDPSRFASTAEQRRRELIEARQQAYPYTILAADARIPEFRTLAKKEFLNFYETVGVQIVRFAREEYTPTHLRVLTALMAIHDPPTAADAIGGWTSDQVAAAEGQLDSQEMLMAEMPSSFGFGQDFSLNYRELPPRVIDRRLTEFEEWQSPSRQFLIEYTRFVAQRLDRLLESKRVSVFTGVDERSLSEWAGNNSKPGRAEVVRPWLKPLALEFLVTQLEGNQRDQRETSLLLDHVRLAIVARFGTDDRSVRQTPAELEGVAAEQWVTVLRRHGFYANGIPDGPGAVDPLAICTTKDRGEALSEPVFGAIYVDGLVEADDGLTEADDVLWAARRQLPFVMLDDPLDNDPEVKRLVSLPGNRAIYRVRWEVWTGWHLLWALDPVSLEGETYRLALRTAAICDDVVMAPPGLVPTLVRAAVLEGDFRPVSIVPGDGSQARQAFEAEPSNEELFDDSRDFLTDVFDASDTAERLADADDPELAIEDAGQLIKELPRGEEEEAPIRPVPGDTVAYLRGLITDPLAARTGGRPSVLVVFEESAVRTRRKVRFGKPRSPYLWSRSKQNEGFVYTAAWAYHVPPPDAEAPGWSLIAPAFLPTESVNTQSLVQKWSRRRTSNWTLTASMAAFPYRRAVFECGKTADDDGVTVTSPDPSTVAPCDPTQSFTPTSGATEGFAWDLGGFRTIWTSSSLRWAVEFGPEARFEMVHQGTPWLNAGQVQYAWSYRYQFGIVGGLRFGPPAFPLSKNARSFPWGADRPDGTSRLNRLEFGLRLGALMGPGFNGMEATALAEGWGGWSIRRKRSKGASFTPYHPGMLLGPFVRLSHSRLLAPGEVQRYYDMKHATAVHVGVRFHLKVDSSASDVVPEGG